METLTDLQSGLSSIRKALQQKQFPTAVLWAKELVITNPQSAEAFDLLGVCHAMSGNREEATVAFASSLKLRPGSAATHFNYALVLEQLNRLDEAVEECQTALYIEPTHERAKALQAAIRQKMRDTQRTSLEGFAVVSSENDPTKTARPEWMKLQCAYCGGMNYVTAVVCRKCNSRMKDTEDIVPVE
jgi:tetratricopeptide (TPR) repeat protein